MNRIISCIALLACFFIFSFPGLHGSDIRKVLIFQTADIHSHVFGENNAWLKIASLLRKERSLNTAKNNHLLIDCGDTLTGTLMGRVSKGQAGAIMLNALDYDVWVPGNHDFELREKRLTEVCRYLKPDILAANLHWGKEFVKPWKMYYRNDVKIAVIGLTSPHLKEWLWGDEMDRFNVSSMVTALDKIIPEVMDASPHMIILAAHHGRYSPKRLNGVNMSIVAKRFPQIDLILGSHSHLEVAGQKIGMNSWYVSCGPHAAKLSKIEALVNIAEGKVNKISSTLIPINSEIADANCNQTLRQFKFEADKCRNELIGRRSANIKRNKDLTEHSSMYELFGKAISSASGVSVVFHGILDESASLFAGKPKPIYGENLFKAVPFDDTICILNLNKNELTEILSEQLKLKYKQHFQALYGVTLTADSLADRNSWEFNFTNGERLFLQKTRVPVAFSSYALAGAGGRFPALKQMALKKECQGRNTGIYVNDAVKEYIQDHSPLKIDPKQWIKIRSK